MKAAAKTDVVADKETTLLAQARDIAFVAAIFLFFLGFSYEREVLSLLGVATLSDFNAAYFITFAFDALGFASGKFTFAISTISALVVAVCIGLQFVDHVGPARGKTIARALVLIAVVAAFPTLHYYAFNASRNAVSSILGSSGIVAAVSNSGAVPEALRKDNDACLTDLAAGPVAKHCYLRLVHEDVGTAYLCDAHLSNALGRTFEVQKKDGVSIIRVSRP